MKNLKITALALAVIACAACGSSPKNLAEPYHISLDITGISPDAPPATLSAMVDSIEYIPLEYAPEMPVGSIMSMAVTDDHIIVFDFNTGLLQFRRDGTFVRRIGNKGRGPGEYNMLFTIFADPLRGILNAFDSGSVNSLQYDLATGRFMGERAITENGEPLNSQRGVMSMVPLSDDRLLLTQGRMMSFYGNTPLSDVHVDSYRVLDLATMNITHSRPSPVYTDTGFTGEWALRRTPTWVAPDGRATFYENIADTMYTVGAHGGLTPRIVPDFGMHKMSLGREVNGVDVGEVRESGRYIIFSTTFDEKNYHITFDKQTGERRIALQPEERLFGGPANDVDGGFSSFGPYDGHIWTGSYQAIKMIETLTPEHFESVRAGVKDPAAMARLQALVAGLSEDDNPIIAIAHLKP